jgi:hypothetical protein
MCDNNCYAPIEKILKKLCQAVRDYDYELVAKYYLELGEMLVSYKKGC